MKIRKGMTIIEVVIAFAVMGVVASMVAGVVTGAYRLAVMAKKLPPIYYSTQEKLEVDLKKLRDLAEIEQTAQEKLDNNSIKLSAAEKRALQAEITAAQNERKNIANVRVETLTGVFGRRVKLYRIMVNVVDGKETMPLGGGVAQASRISRPVPVIGSATMTLSGSGLPEELYYDSIGKNLNVSAQVSANKDYLEKLLFNWQSTEENLFHTNDFKRSANSSELYSGITIPSYPRSFYSIRADGTELQENEDPDQERGYIKIREEMMGKFILCSVSPLSKNGKKGDSVVTNRIYISPLPKLSKNASYVSNIEPSLHTLDDYEAYGDKMDLAKDSEIPSRKVPRSNKYADEGEMEFKGRGAYISLTGTRTHPSNAKVDGAVFSRYIQFNNNCSAVIDTEADKGLYVFAVEKHTVKAGDDQSIFSQVWTVAENLNIQGTHGKNGQWRAMYGKFNDVSSEIYFGNSDVAFAEILVVDSPTPDDCKKIMDYLKNKYQLG